MCVGDAMQVRHGEEFDTDNEEHMQWVYERALERAKLYGIQVSICAVGTVGKVRASSLWLLYSWSSQR